MSFVWHTRANLRCFSSYFALLPFSNERIYIWLCEMRVVFFVMCLLRRTAPHWPNLLANRFFLLSWWANTIICIHSYIPMLYMCVDVRYMYMCVPTHSSRVKWTNNRKRMIIRNQGTKTLTEDKHMHNAHTHTNTPAHTHTCIDIYEIRDFGCVALNEQNYGMNKEEELTK